MALSLCIDTSSKNCSVAIFENSKLISVKEKKFDKPSHSEKVNVFVDILLKEKKYHFQILIFLQLVMVPVHLLALELELLQLKLFVLLIKNL